MTSTTKSRKKQNYTEINCLKCKIYFCRDNFFTFLSLLNCYNINQQYLGKKFYKNTDCGYTSLTHSLTHKHINNTFTHIHSHTHRQTHRYTQKRQADPDKSKYKYANISKHIYNICLIRNNSVVYIYRNITIINHY